MTTQPAIDQRPTHETPDSPRDELAALLAAWMEQAHHQAERPLTYRQMADALLEHAMRIDDHWDHVDVSGVGQPPETSVVHQRYLAVYIPRHIVPFVRDTDRSVG